MISLRLRQGEDRFRQLFARFHRRVYYVAFSITKDPHLAQDISQETFFKAYRHFGNIQEGEKVGAWLHAIAANTAIDMLRKNKRRSDIPTEDEVIHMYLSLPQQGSTVERQIERRHDASLLVGCIRSMKNQDREVLIYKYGMQLKDDEIAGRLNLSVGTVKSRLHRAKRRLRRLIEAEAPRLDQPTVHQ